MTSSSRLTTGAVALAVAGATLAVLAPASAAPADSRSVPRCTNADLKASYHRGQGAAGTIYGHVVLRNRSDRSCETGGYGGLSYVGGGDGTQVGAPAVRTNASDVQLFVLRPGQRLRSLIGETHAQNYPAKRCRPAHVDGFRVYVPNSHVAQFVVHPTTGCRNDHVKLIEQRPYRRP